jgi:hypothetical protein
MHLVLYCESELSIMVLGMNLYPWLFRRASVYR